MTSTFFYEYRQKNVYNEQGINVFGPMENILTQITNPNVVLETIGIQNSYLEARKSIEEKRDMVSDDICTTKLKQKLNMYNSYSDRTREVSIDRVLESAEERERTVRFAKELGVELYTAW